MKINIAIADDHPAILSGIAYELSTIRTLNIVGKAKNSTEIIDILNDNTCDVLISDYVMPGGSAGDGIAMFSFLRRHYPGLRIIVFTIIDNPAIVAELLKLGIGSVLNKGEDIGHLISAIHAVYAGATYISPHFNSVTNVLGGAETARPSHSKLTRREAEVIRLYVSGLSVNDIASQLKRTKQTVSSQKSSAMKKLQITRDADLFRFAFETGMTSIG
ncbi:LuxR family transcriptional regulator [Enterobacter cloacae subsp. cloacae]|uniref:response regulator transcription factor n=1 Tax=Enterobacter cloacae TaxID=550 RepID=UPI00063AF1A2|nr:response regulator transcription factor [Enterobacter cloacae]KLG11722.1 LuxR family transcriptional regulator [Enterobacter cloacae subsp. cloacae]